MGKVTVGGDEGNVKYLSDTTVILSRGSAAHPSGSVALPRQLKRWDCKACCLSYGLRIFWWVFEHMVAH
jgi:hypothetical protein